MGARPHETKEKLMIGSVRKKLTYGNVMATIAVFLVLGGATAVAAGLGKNAVKTKNIKNGAVTTAKLGADAVTGAKANESSFGIVPQAQNATTAANATKAIHAETATSATTAVKANSATTAETATSANSAKTAATAADAALLDGRSLTQIRGGVTSASSAIDVNILEAGNTMISLNAQISAAGDLLGNASIRVTNNGAQGFVECQLQNEGAGSFEPMGQFIGQTMPAGNTIQLPLTGVADGVPPKGFSDPENVRVFCKTANVGGPYTFESGDLVVQRVAIG
jgi:hypothetical protein